MKTLFSKIADQEAFSVHVVHVLRLNVILLNLAAQKIDSLHEIADRHSVVP